MFFTRTIQNVPSVEVIRMSFTGSIKRIIVHVEQIRRNRDQTQPAGIDKQLYGTINKTSII